jgi:hypothetical protein
MVISTFTFQDMKAVVWYMIPIAVQKKSRFGDVVI